MSARVQDRQLDRLELAALAYLLAPWPVFAWAWWRWPVAFVLTALLIFMARTVVAARQRDAGRLPASAWLLLATVAVVWVAASGLLGGVPLNGDWQVRMRVLRDLTLNAWPVGYGDVGGHPSLLRLSLGYYLLPAGIGSWLGDVVVARACLGLWTVVGVMLFFALVLQAAPVRRLAASAGLLALLTLFSGMDIMGFLVGRAQVPAPGEHLEWWSPWFQYSSQTTLLFWVPNHALPAWLGAALVWRHRECGLAAPPGALLLVAGALWSPLACVGLLPLVLLAMARGQPVRETVRACCQAPVVAALPLLGLLAVFVSFGIVAGDTEPAGPRAADVAATSATWYEWLTFALLEWGFVAAALLSAAAFRRSWVFLAACVLLVLLPFLRFGPGNDLVMRGGIAPMTVLMLCVAQALFGTELLLRWRRALLLMLALGCVTPAQELLRQAQPGSRWPDDGRTLVQALGRPWHYVGVLRPGWLAAALKPPKASH